MKISFTVMLVLVLNASFAQSKSVTATQTAAQVFSATWGPVASGSSLAIQVASIAAAPILVKDAKGNAYPVNSFRMNYKFKSTYRDDESGQLKSMNDLRVADFSNTAQLSQVWYESIKDNVKPGDTVLINKILFRNASGKLQLAPDIRIAVK